MSNSQSYLAMEVPSTADNSALNHLAAIVPDIFPPTNNTNPNTGIAPAHFNAQALVPFTSSSVEMPPFSPTQLQDPDIHHYFTGIQRVLSKKDEKIKELEKEKAELLDENRKLRAQLDTSTSKMEEMRKCHTVELAAVNSKLEKLRVDRKTKKEPKKEEKQESPVEQRVVGNYKRWLTNQNKLNVDLVDENKQLEDENLQLRKAIENLDGVQEHALEVQNDLDKFKVKVSELETERDFYRRQITKAQDVESQQQEVSENLERQLNIRTTELAEMRRTVDAQMAANTELQSKVRQYEREAWGPEQRIANLKNSNEETEDNLSDLKRKCRKLEMANKLTNKSARATVAMSVAKEEEIKTLSDQLEEARATLYQRNGEIEQLKRMLGLQRPQVPKKRSSESPIPGPSRMTRFTEPTSAAGNGEDK